MTCRAGERGEVGVSPVLGFSLAGRQGLCACPLTPTSRQFQLVSSGYSMSRPGVCVGVAAGPSSEKQKCTAL